MALGAKGKLAIYLGFDPREATAFAVARYSIRRRLSLPIKVKGLHLENLRAQGLYKRPTSYVSGRLFDNISGAPMSTEFAISRFLVPIIQRDGWAIFADCDILAMENLARLFDLADPDKAVLCVHHVHVPQPGEIKMDNQLQLTYARKNWSSVMLINCSHPSNRKLTPDMVNSLPGRDLHRFCWLKDSEIGELPVEWNYLVGHSDAVNPPKIVHYTDGYPLMAGYENCQYAPQWQAEFRDWAVG